VKPKRLRRKPTTLGWILNVVAGVLTVALIVLQVGLRAHLIDRVYGLYAMGAVIIVACPILIWLLSGWRRRSQIRETFLQRRAEEESRPIVGSRSYDGK
jgi:uncharacterized membrane protein YkvI